MSGNSAYKAEHEQFTSNLKGTSILCIILCILHVPACLLISKLVQWRRKPNWIRDYAFLVVPQLLSITVLHNHSYWSLPCLLSLGFVASKLQRNIIDKTTGSATDLSSILGAHKAYLSYFKGSNMLLTCLSILAVDFKVFPRRFAKTELFGVGLMDIGVGLFIVASAFTSRTSRGLVEKGSIITSNNRMMVLLLGVCRTLVVKLLSYQEKVSEYGAHWNFFITLFCVWTIADVAHRCLPRLGILFLAAATLYCYQFVLNHTLLVDFVITAPRNTLFSANREGILSLFGQVPLYLLAELLSYYLFFDGKAAVEVESIPTSALSAEAPPISDDEQQGDSKEPMGSRWRVLSTGPLRSLLLKISGAFVFVFVLWILASSVQPTSRRLCNAAYVLLILALSLFVILCIIIADVIGGVHVRILTLQHMNDYQLPIFLGANLLTGFVNMSMKTIYASQPIAMIVLLLYAAVITGGSWVLARVMRLSIKPSPSSSKSSDVGGIAAAAVVDGQF